MIKRTTYIAIVAVLVICVFQACTTENATENKKNDGEQDTDLTRIMKSGKLRALVDYGYTDYFIYQGKPMGFKYEILQHLANDMQVKLEITANNDLDENFRSLRDHHFDVAAINFTVTRERRNLIDFTVPVEQTHQVLVQRKPEGWESMSAGEIEQSLVRNQLDLAGKLIHVPRNSSHYKRLVNLSDEIGETIEIVQDSVYSAEQLIALVAEGKIDFTVCDENIAKINNLYYPRLDVNTPVSFPQNLAWAVPPGSGEWLNYLNHWLVNFKKTSDFAHIYNRYFSRYRSSLRVNSDYHSNLGGKLSIYDDMIREESQQAGIDWRLVAAVIFHESRFDENAESWRGAYGLMQITVESAQMFRIDDYMEPRSNVKTGISLLMWLDNYFREEVPDSVERLKFVLASYNAGLGHVKDAQRLAEKYDRIPIVWTDNVDFFLRNKSVAKYYRDEVVKWGYCRGEEPYSFVNKVIDTYNHYLNIIEEEPLPVPSGY